MTTIAIVQLLILRGWAERTGAQVEGRCGCWARHIATVIRRRMTSMMREDDVWRHFMTSLYNDDVTRTTRTTTEDETPARRHQRSARPPENRVLIPAAWRCRGDEAIIDSRKVVSPTCIQTGARKNWNIQYIRYDVNVCSIAVLSA